MSEQEVQGQIIKTAMLSIDFTMDLNDGTTITDTGVKFGKSMSMASYERMLTLACKLQKISQWAIGDIINAAEKQYGEASVYGRVYPLLAEMLGRDEEDMMFQQYVRNMAYVSRNVKTRYAQLSWSHHREVASLSEENQKLVLEYAISMPMTVKQTAVFAAQYKNAMKVFDAPVAAPKMIDSSIHKPVEQEQKVSRAKIMSEITQHVELLVSEEDYVSCAAIMASTAIKKIGFIPTSAVTTMVDAMRTEDRRVLNEYVQDFDHEFTSNLDRAFGIASSLTTDEIDALKTTLELELKHRKDKK